MVQYQVQDVLRTAKRIHNPRRSYLLMNPLQGKHIPVSPSKTMALAGALGELLLQQAGEAGLVIGFAETATALGALAALRFPEETLYLHTTRETLSSGNRIHFFEEHSHAADQQLESSCFENRSYETVIMIDDEISTGKTIRNIIRALKERFPSLENTRFVVGSVINRMPQTTREEMAQEEIRFVSLVDLQEDYMEEAVRHITAFDPQPICGTGAEYEEHLSPVSIPNLRLPMTVGEMKRQLRRFARALSGYLQADEGSLLLLGTEECMTPAIYTGAFIEQTLPGAAVFSHSTTRSPIGICHSPGYPCRSGYSLHSFYETERRTFLYNLSRYDRAAVITDSSCEEAVQLAMRDITEMFSDKVQKIYLIRG